MNRKEKEKYYDDYIERISKAAEAAGRRVPYHLEYLRKHGSPPSPKGDNRAGRTGRKQKQNRRNPAELQN